MNVHVEIDEGFANISGGEYEDKWGGMDEYTLQFKDGLDVEMCSSDLKKLAVEAINHLIINGHRFEFGCSDMGKPKLEVI